MSRPRSAFQLAILILLSFCFHFDAVAQNASGQPGATSKPSPPEGAVVIEEFSKSVRFESDGNSQQTVRQKTKILNEAGLKQFGILSFSFTEGQKFNLDLLEVHKKDGSVVKGGPANIQETTPEVSRVAPTYSDLREKQVTVPGLSVGDEVYFQYSTTEPAIVPGQFWFQYSFEKDLAIDSESLAIDVPRSVKLKVHYLPEYKPVITESGDRVLYQWKSSHQMEPESEDAAKNAKLSEEILTGTNPAPSVELSTFQSWEEVGSWYYALQKERAAVTPAIKAKALELTSGIADPQAKAQALYQFVSLNFRYISLDFGIGRYQPHAADEVLANKYGDCKDKHTLLAALLAAVGLQAQPVLINSSRLLEPSVPSPGQFDHVITAVSLGKDMLFLDTTAEVAPYGLLIPPLRKKEALLVSGGAGSHLLETPADPPVRAQEQFELKGKLDDSGTLEADISYEVHGDSELVLKSAFRAAPPEKYKDLVQYISYATGFAGEVSKVEVNGLQDLNHGLRINYHYHRPEYLELQSREPEHELPMPGSHIQSWDDKDESVRLYGSSAEALYKCRIEFPTGVTLQLPLALKLNREYATYESQYSSENNILTAQRSLTIIAPQVRGDHRQDYEAFRRAITADEGQQLVVHLPVGFVAKSTGTGDDLDQLMRQADIEYRERNFNDAYADYRKVANQDAKHKGVWA